MSLVSTIQTISKISSKFTPQQRRSRGEKFKMVEQRESCSVCSDKWGVFLSLALVLWRQLSAGGGWGGKERFNETLILFLGLHKGKRRQEKRGRSLTCALSLWSLRGRRGQKKTGEEKTEQTLDVKEFNELKTRITTITYTQNQNQIHLDPNVVDYHFPDVYDFPNLDNLSTAAKLPQTNQICFCCLNH